MQPGNTVNLTYTDTATNTQHNVTIVRVDDPAALPLSNAGAKPNSPVIGVNFTGGMASVVSQLNAALGAANLQFSNPSGSTLRVLDFGTDAATVNAASVTATTSSLASGNAQLPLFTDGNSLYTGAITGERLANDGICRPHHGQSRGARQSVERSRSTAPRRRPRPATPRVRTFSVLAADLGDVQLFAANRARLDRDAVQRARSPATCSNSSACRPMRPRRRRSCSRARTSSSTTLQQKFNSTSGVNIDTEMANLISLQNTYAANAHVMSVVQTMMKACCRLKCKAIKMAINSIKLWRHLLLGQSVQNINNQLTNLSTQLATGEKSTTYAGMGVNEGFAIAARSQLANISAFTDTMTNVNTDHRRANTALQAMVDTASNGAKRARTASSQTLNSTGQTIGQQNARRPQLSSMVGILNTQAGDRYMFSGSAINTPSVASADDILNGTATQAGLKQVIAERQQADLGTNGLGRLVISTLADADLGAGRRRCRRLAVRPEAELGVVVADRCDGDRSRRLAAVDLGRPRRHQSQIRAIRSASRSICPTAPPNRSS